MVLADLVTVAESLGEMRKGSWGKDVASHLQDGSSPSLFRDQKIYFLPVLEYGPYQAVLAL